MTSQLEDHECDVKTVIWLCPFLINPQGSSAFLRGSLKKIRPRVPGTSFIFQEYGECQSLGATSCTSQKLLCEGKSPGFECTLPFFRSHGRRVLGSELSDLIHGFLGRKKQTFACCMCKLRYWCMVSTKGGSPRQVLHVFQALPPLVGKLLGSRDITAEIFSEAWGGRA